MSPRSAVADDVIVETDNSNNSTAQSEGVFQNYSGGSVQQNFEGSTPVPYLPGVISAPAISPTLFSLKGFPAQATGLPLLSKVLFPIEYHDVATGKSNGTRIVYNGSRVPERKKRNRKRSVFVDFSGVGEGEIVGSITIQSRKNKADEVDIATLIYDATQYIRDVDRLKGYDLTLLTLSNTLTYTLGVDAKSSGFSLSPVLSGFIEGPAGILAGLSGGATKSGGVTVPTALVGCTFLVLADTENSSVVDITHCYSSKQEDSGNGNGNSRKKYKATETGEE